MRRFLLYLVAAFLGTSAALLMASLFGLFLLGLLLSAGGAPVVERGSVLVVDLSGAIADPAPIDPFEELLVGEPITTRDVTEALEKAAADGRIEAVWLRPADVAASWATLSELRAAVEAFRASGKPVIATSGPDGFSEAGYYLATAADSIFAPPEAGFEIDGFFLSVPFFAGTLEKLGIEPVVVRAGAYKSAAETFTNRQFSPENEEQYAELVQQTAATFRTAVAASRPVALDELDRIIDTGAVLGAEDAYRAGLLDGLLYDDAVRDRFRLATEQDADEELRTVELADYVAVPRGDAGLALGDPDHEIALVYAVGTILSGESAADGGSGPVLGSETFTEAIDEALWDDDTRALVVRVNSPGGAATASDVMWAAVERAAERVPVVVSMGPVAASGGYYIAAPADAILAEPNTITGSIGVISLLFDATAFFNDKLGITFDAIETGPYAGIGAPGEPLSEAEREILQRQTEEIYATFVARVAEGRDLPVERVRELGGGRVYTGERAVELGLVDELGSLEDALALAAELAELEPDGYRIRVRPEPKDLFERLGDTFGAQAWARPVVRALLDRSVTPEERLLRRQAALLRTLREIHAVPQARLLFDPEVH
ncbi:MAG: signal peptide peptidase SppA [Rhodothermales bacterium]|nr:signal peptide peptidase SppA [Rhodothermales bacterium]